MNATKVTMSQECVDKVPIRMSDEKQMAIILYDYNSNNELPTMTMSS